ncbi:MAG: M61 family metallopeptidase [Crocinitomicaceae bacterium]|nr:M61 family metallopeptidase [Crocinitomicaceae bacterium]
MKYTFSMSNPSSHFLEIELEISEVDNNKLQVQLPAWRPGRYELANFSKNIQKMEVKDQDEQPLSFFKRSKDLWEIDTSSAREIKIKYNYYAAELNAGSTWLDEHQLYVNPVNCCLYLPDRMEEQCEVVVDVPYPYEVATGLTETGKFSFIASDFHELADSPFIASPTLQHEYYEVGKTKFHIWFQGEIKPNWSKIQLDFERFTEKQIAAFGQFPSAEFHFLFQITSYPSYHGVEHSTSTVCQLGPSYDIMGAKYIDFLGVASHELYHAWNVKAIRPKELFPYDYSKENYSKLGYVYEGVTTYMGDKFLFSANVIDQQQYFKELENYLNRHYHNGGRFNLSVSDSSFDTWLDGYVAGVPHRKTSIYAEGCLFSFILDVALTVAEASSGGLDEVMRRLYVDLAQNKQGYAREDYERISNSVAGCELNYLFEELIDQPVEYTKHLNWALEMIGLELIFKDDQAWTKKLGLKGTYRNESFVVSDVGYGSDAANFNLNRGDIIKSVNGFNVQGDLDKWLGYFGEEKQELGIVRNKKHGVILIQPTFKNGFRNCNIQQVQDASQQQQTNYNKWLNK